MSTRRSNQGGAILTFIIIAVVLAAVTMGSIYFVQKRGEQARREQAVARADKITADEKKKATDSSASAAKSSDTESAGIATTMTDTKTVASKSAELPHTGAREDGVKLLAVGLLVAMTTAYISSRRALKRPL